MKNAEIEKIIVIGGRGTATNIAEHIIHANKVFSSRQEFIGFAIDDESLGREINGMPVLCKVKDLHEKYKKSDVKLIYALYRPDVMEARVQLFNSLNFAWSRFTNFIHPLAYVSPSVKMGLGNAVLSNSSIQANVTIGNGNIINSSVVIEHDTTVNNHNFLAASVCIGAKVEIGNGIFIGMNATIREKINISDFSFIGMGSNLLTSVENNRVVYGNPAKIRE